MQSLSTALNALNALFKSINFNLEGLGRVRLLSDKQHETQIVRLKVVQKLDNAIHRINHYSMDKCYGNQLRCLVDSDLSGG